MQFLRLVDLSVFWLLSTTASTPRARARLWSEQYQLLGPRLPYYTMGERGGLLGTYSLTVCPRPATLSPRYPADRHRPVLTSCPPTSSAIYAIVPFLLSLQVFSSGWYTASSTLSSPQRYCSSSSLSF